MMSLHSSTHSSQMYTDGPAMSLRTSFWDLPQNEQQRSFPSGPFRRKSLSCAGRLSRALALRVRVDDLVDDAVFQRLRCRHDVVALGVVAHAILGLAGVVGDRGD